MRQSTREKAPAFKRTFISHGSNIIHRNIASIASLLFSFPRGFLFQKKSLYALLGGWLLLSQPSLCLRFKTTFDTLSLQLGALASVWVLSLSDAKITPAPSLRRICKQIRSLTRLVGISPLDNLISALPRLH